LRKIAVNRVQTLAITVRSFLEANLKTTEKKKKLWDKSQRIGLKPWVLLFVAFCKATLKLIAKNTETLGQIADNRFQTLAIINRSILEDNLKTTKRKQQNFGTNSRQ